MAADGHTMSYRPQTDHLAPDGRTRRRGWIVRILAVLGFVLFDLSFAGVALEAAGGRDEALHLVGALVVMAMVTSALVALVISPDSPGSAFQIVAAMAAMLVVLAIVGDPDNYGGQAGPFDLAYLLFIVPRLAAATVARRWRRGPIGAGGLRWLGLAVAAAPVAAWYGVEQALLQRNSWPPTADPHHNGH
jgi:uncharacterized membrane protein YhaH (DUF805 family)